MPPDSLPPMMRMSGTERSWPPRSSDLMRALAAIEAKFPVQEWHVNGLHVWPLLRIRWYFAEWARHYTDDASPHAQGRWQNLVGTGWDMVANAATAGMVQLKDRSGWDRSASQRDLVFLSDGISFSKLGEHWFDRFCDPIIKQAEQRRLSHALWTPATHYHHPRATPSRFVQPALDRLKLTAALKNRQQNATTAHLPDQLNLQHWLAAQGFGTAPIQADRVKADALRLRAFADMYASRLRQAQPRMAFIVCYYGLDGMAFVLACQECGIPVVDIQHGVEGPMHPAYASWSLTTTGPHPMVPDYFWVWSDWERDAIEQWSKGHHHKAVVGGNPWASLWADDSPWPGINAALARSARLKQQARGKPVVLVTLQWGISLVEQITPLLGLLQDAGERFFFWIRLHPLMLGSRETIRAQLGQAGNFNLDEASDVPLQALLKQVDAHMTHSSAVVIDAMQYGIRSVVTSLYGEELFEPLYKDGWVVTEEGGTEALVRALEICQSGHNRPSKARAPLHGAFETLMACAAASAKSPGESVDHHR